MKWIFRYLRDTFRICLCFSNGKLMLEGYTDTHMADEVDIRKSTFGFLMTFAREVVSWKSKLQSVLPYLPLRLSI